jgi:hypothetical protein
MIFIIIFHVLIFDQVNKKCRTITLFAIVYGGTQRISSDAEVFSNSNKEISTTFDPNQERTATTHLITTNTVTTTTPLITNTEGTKI